MIFLIRGIQVALIIAALAAGTAVVAMAIELVDNANAKCALPYTGEDSGPSAGCAGVAKFQAEATATVAIALAGLTTMIGAVALNGMVPREQPGTWPRAALAGPPTGTSGPPTGATWVPGQQPGSTGPSGLPGAQSGPVGPRPGAPGHAGPGGPTGHPA